MLVGLRGVEVIIYAPLEGVIKGSEEALKSPTGVLTEQEYLSLSSRGQSTFVGQREVVYQLFLIYQKKKRHHRDYDSADRSVAGQIHCRGHYNI